MTTPQFSRRSHRAREILAAVGRAYPQAWAYTDRFRAVRGGDVDDWPDWCYLPIAAGYAIASGGGDNRVPFASAHHPAVITALAAWRMTQGIYRYDPALYPALVDTSITSEIPESALYRLPEWCVYIETPGMVWEDRALHGVWAHMECDVARDEAAELRLVLDAAADVDAPLDPYTGLCPIPLILGGGDLPAALRRVIDSGVREARKHGMSSPPSADDLSPMTQVLAPILSLLLYLCSESPDLTRRGRPDAPVNPEPVRTRRHGWRLFAAEGPREWDVGVRIGAALRAAYAREETGGEASATGRHVRPHVRRAHWHTILSGARLRDDGTPIPSAERRAELRWMPPIPVAVEDAGELPAVVHRVRP